MRRRGIGSRPGPRASHPGVDPCYRVDEIQDAKGHKYLTLLYQIDQGFTRLLWVGKERTLESFQGFFTMIGEQLDHKCVFARESRHERP